MSLFWALEIFSKICHQVNQMLKRQVSHRLQGYSTIKENYDVTIKNLLRIFSLSF